MKITATEDKESFIIVANSDEFSMLMAALVLTVDAAPRDDSDNRQILDSVFAEFNNALFDIDGVTIVDALNLI